MLISACLCGVNCKYNGSNNLHEVFLHLLKQDKVLPLCPEQLGGLSTPRNACEIQGGTGYDVLHGKAQVMDNQGHDVSDKFTKGARETLELARQAGIKEAVLQRRSPSCGCGRIYDGSFSGKLVDGDGVTAALLKECGIKVWNDEDYIREYEAQHK